MYHGRKRHKPTGTYKINKWIQNKDCICIVKHWMQKAPDLLLIRGIMASTCYSGRHPDRHYKFQLLWQVELALKQGRFLTELKKKCCILPFILKAISYWKSHRIQPHPPLQFVQGSCLLLSAFKFHYSVACRLSITAAYSSQVTL